MKKYAALSYSSPITMALVVPLLQSTKAWQMWHLRNVEGHVAIKISPGLVPYLLFIKVNSLVKAKVSAYIKEYDEVVCGRQEAVSI